MAKAIEVIHVGIYNNLMAQIQKAMSHCNQNSEYETHPRYLEAASRFSKFLADQYKVQRFANVQPKHLEAYSEYLLDFRENAVKYIKTELSGIRFVYDQVGGKYKLPENEDMEIGRAKSRGVDRAWNDDEVRSATHLARSMGHEDIAFAMQLAEVLGLRLHESGRVHYSDLTRALKVGSLRIKGKGGKIRDIPLTDEARQVIKRILDWAVKGQKVFIPPGLKTHQFLERVQNWIWRHRGKFSNRKISYHGLRHRYARTQYEFALERLKSDLEARRYVSRLLGHERDEVTRVYLAPTRRGFVA